MVGVPGKSKGCKTCKSRKVKCDQGKPSCMRCLKIGRECEGYDNSPIFVNRSSTVTSGQVRYRKPARTTTTEDKSRQMQLVSSSASSDPMTHYVHYDSVEKSTLRISDAALNAEQLAASFLSSWLPRSKLGQDYDGKGGVFMQTMCGTRKDPSLHTAMQALAMTRLGFMHEDEALVQRGRKCYGVALRQLQTALYHPKLMSSDQTIATSSILAIYELWEGTSSVFGWNGHATGVAKMIRLRGPKAWKSPLAYAVYDSARHNQMIRAIQNRRSSFLGSSEWIYETRGPKGRSLDERLLYAGYKIADLHAEMDRVKARLEGRLDVESCIDFLTRCDQLSLFLDEWYADYEESEAPQGALFWVQGSSSPGNSDEDVASGPQEGPTPRRNFIFSDQHTAFDLMRYWAMRLFISLNSLFSLLDLPISSSDGTELSPSTDAFIISMSQRHTYEERVTIARNILRSVDFFLAEDQGLLGAQRLLFPLRVAMVIFKTHQHIPGAAEDLALCEQKNDYLARVKGLKYAGELTKDGSYDKWSHRTVEYISAP